MIIVGLFLARCAKLTVVISWLFKKFYNLYNFPFKFDLVYIFTMISDFFFKEWFYLNNFYVTERKKNKIITN